MRCSKKALQKLRSMLWIAVCLPELPLEVAAADALPLAVCDASHVLLASRIAREIGVQARMRRATALAICPHLHIKLRTYAQENHALQAIAAWAQRFTPNVALVPPCEESDADIASDCCSKFPGSVKLFNGHTRIVKQSARRSCTAGIRGTDGAGAGAAGSMDVGTLRT